MAKNIRIGLDLSINSTGVVISDGRHTEYHLIVPNVTKKQAKCTYIQYHTYVKLTPLDGAAYNDKEMVKTSNLLEIVRIIEEIISKYKNIKSIGIEGVAFGASGDVVGLAGLNYMVRYMLTSHKLPYTIISPMQNKKFATGNGGADKDLMMSAFKMCTNFANPLGVKIDDIADAYFLSECAASVQ